MKFSRPKIDWRPILLEAGFVVLGVVLALGVNEWRKSYVDRRNAETALASIREELQANRAVVSESFEYHVGLTEALNALTASGPGAADPGSSTAYPDRSLFARGFFRPATLLHTAWDAAGATDAVRHMRYADVLRLAQIYEEQERYRRQSEQVGQLIYGQLFNHGFTGMIQNYANLSTILSTFWYRECQLLRRYDEVLGELRAGPAEATAEVPDGCRHLPVS